MPKPNSKIPAWVIGLWREWADWRQSDGYDGDLDRGADIAAMDLAMRTPGVVSQGPVVRALIALEQAQHGPAAMADLFYRQLPDELKTIIWGVYVERMSFARLGQGDEARRQSRSPGELYPRHLEPFLFASDPKHAKPDKPESPDDRAAAQAARVRARMEERNRQEAAA